ncbi:acylphosphatase-2-like [Phlebotomus argentipes]|uniref:acylphosphatase-2-like n=1 Tax=Phlebotomus argentipes TaxID=94469 RepID=UPI002892FB67|nr:acylphosphatase-2-like [Phlebotomus argentipes]
MLSNSSFRNPRKLLQTIILLFCCTAPVFSSNYCDSDAESISECREAEMAGIISCEFEVFGIVQGVFFRKHTQKQASELGLKGWCMNTYDGTVKGVMEGSPDQIRKMKDWLQHVGSPQSKIDKAVFSPDKSIPDYTFTKFSVKH